MPRALRGFLAAVVVLTASPALAQTGDGRLRGFVKDEQGAVLPGVSVTAHNPAELAGFAAWRFEGIVMRAGTTFTVDVQLRIGTLAETVTIASR